jgi:hypothetical protein
MQRSDVTNIVLLNSQRHRSLRVYGAASTRYGDNQRFVPVVVEEFAQLVVHYPILMSKDANTGRFFCGAMLGFDRGENLFLKEGKGHEGYRPLNLQRMPFYAAGSDLAIDLEHPRVGAEAGQALFTGSGEPTMYLKSVMQVVRNIKLGAEMTEGFIATLRQHDLIKPIDISVSFHDGSARKLADLYTINQGVLRDLPDPVVLDLFRRGYLALIELMTASVKQVGELARKKNALLLRGTATQYARIN